MLTTRLPRAHGDYTSPSPLSAGLPPFPDNLLCPESNFLSSSSPFSRRLSPVVVQQHVTIRESLFLVPRSLFMLAGRLNEFFPFPPVLEVNFCGIDPPRPLHLYRSARYFASFKALGDDPPLSHIEVFPSSVPSLHQEPCAFPTCVSVETIFLLLRFFVYDCRLARNNFAEIYCGRLAFAFLLDGDLRWDPRPLF